eukprot:2467325-Rhodomonas_salina.1
MPGSVVGEAYQRELTGGVNGVCALQIYGVTPLYAAADVGALDTVVRLIEAKCDVEKSAPVRCSSL